MDISNKIIASGHLLTEKVAKLINIFATAGQRVGGSIPAMLLRGLPGAGKTSLAEEFAKAVGADLIFYQVTADTDASRLIGDINPRGIVSKDSSKTLIDGVLVRAAKAQAPLVLVLDEWDKASDEADAFLLDYLQSRRVTDMEMNTLYTPESNFWIFLTSNEEREISDALRRRVRVVEVDRLPTDQIAGLLNLPVEHPVVQLWERFPQLALSQIRDYIADCGGTASVREMSGIDPDILSQYIEGLEEVLSEEEQKAREEAARIEETPDPRACTCRIDVSGYTDDFRITAAREGMIVSDYVTLTNIDDVRKLVDLSSAANVTLHCTDLEVADPSTAFKGSELYVKDNAALVVDHSEAESLYKVEHRGHDYRWCASGASLESGLLLRRIGR